MKTKQCTKCKEIKSLNNFYKRNEAKDGHRNECDSCQRKHTREWYKDNKERHIQVCNEYRQNNLKKCKQNNKKWMQNNQEKMIQYSNLILQ